MEKLDTKTIHRILNQHSVPNYIEGNRVLADSMEGGTAVFEKVVDLTGMTLSELKWWLGY